MLLDLSATPYGWLQHNTTNGGWIKMAYLKYELAIKIVASIHNEMPETVEDGFSVGISDEYVEGDEIEYLIYVNEVDKDNIVLSTSAAKQSPRASEILRRIKALEDRICIL